MLRAAVPGPGLAPRPDQPALGGDDQTLGVGVKGVGDEPLVDFRPIGVRGVDEGDAEFDDPVQHLPRAFGIARLTPNPRPAQPHRPIAEPADDHVAADGQRAPGGA